MDTTVGNRPDTTSLLLPIGWIIRVVERASTPDTAVDLGGFVATTTAWTAGLWLLLRRLMAERIEASLIDGAEAA